MEPPKPNEASNTSNPSNLDTNPEPIVQIKEPISVPKDEGLIKDRYELIFKELQSVLTIIYLFAVGIGMLFEAEKFSEFGINIFEYADVFDFLTAPFSDAKILLYALGVFLLAG